MLFPSSLPSFKLTSAASSSARATKIIVPKPVFLNNNAVVAGRRIVAAPARIRTTSTSATTKTTPTCYLANKKGRLQPVQQRRRQQQHQQQVQQQSSLAAVYSVPASIETTAGTAAAVGRRITVPRTTATTATTRKPTTTNERASIATAINSTVCRRNKLVQRCHTNNNNNNKHSLSWDQARSLFLSAAVPMVGFGFMDQFIMVSAGSYIDNTLGVQLGLATMSAAACGQVISDSCGVLMGGTLERLLLIAPAKLSSAQQRLPAVRRIKLLGGVLGVITGCVIGAIPLILSSSREEEHEHHHIQQQNEGYEKQQRIGSFLNNVMTSPDERWAQYSARCTLHVRSGGEKQAWPVSSSTTATTTTSNGAVAVVSVSSVRRGEWSDSTTTDPVQQCMDSSADVSIIINDHKLYVPVVGNNNNNHEVVAVLQIESSSSSNGHDFGTPADIDDAKQLARHIGYQL